MRTLLGFGAAFLIGRWLYLNMKKNVEVIVEEVPVKEVIEVATDSWKS